MYFLRAHLILRVFYAVHMLLYSILNLILRGLLREIITNTRRSIKVYRFYSTTKLLRNSESTIRERYLPYPPSTIACSFLSFSLSLILLNRSREITCACATRYCTRCFKNIGTFVNWRMPR